MLVWFGYFLVLSSCGVPVFPISLGGLGLRLGSGGVREECRTRCSHVIDRISIWKRSIEERCFLTCNAIQVGGRAVKKKKKA